MFDVPLKEWMIYVYLLASPFYMFAIATNRDWPALWVVGAMLLLFVVQFSHSGFRFWLDSSAYSLLFFLAAYVIGTIVVGFTDYSVTLLGRTPQDRAITTLIRIVYALIVYGLFINFLGDADDKMIRRIFAFQIVFGAIVALFGIVQYITAAVFSWGGLISLEPTNETFKMGSSFFGIGRTRVYRASAVFQEPSAFGFFLVPLFIKVILAFMHDVIIVSRKFHLTLLAIFVLAILFNFSLTALFSTAILMIILFSTTFRGSRVLLWTSVFTIASLGLILLTPVGSLLAGRVDRVFQFSDVSTLDRLFRAYVGIRIVIESPAFGVGPGLYAYLYPMYGGLERSLLATPLNIWLTFLTDVGIVGFIPFVFFLKNVFGRAKRRENRHPLVRAYLWSTVSFLLLLTTIDLWYLEMFWFDIAMLVVLANGLFVSPEQIHEKVVFA
jgi:O-antigen ligase